HTSEPDTSGSIRSSSTSSGLNALTRATPAAPVRATSGSWPSAFRLYSSSDARSCSSSITRIRAMADAVRFFLTHLDSWHKHLRAMTAADKRRQERIPVELWIEAERDGELYFQRASNLSIGGAFFAQTIPLPLGTKVSLKFELPGEQVEIRCNGEIVTAKDLG